MKIKRLDHLVLTVGDIQRSVDFYTKVLGMREMVFGDGRRALGFGRQKINLHEHKKEFEPRASHPTPGSADLCFIADCPLIEVMEKLKKEKVSLVEGPVSRIGALGKITSVYIRDPDENLIELSEYQHSSSSP